MWDPNDPILMRSRKFNQYVHLKTMPQEFRTEFLIANLIAILIVSIIIHLVFIGNIQLVNISTTDVDNLNNVMEQLAPPVEKTLVDKLEIVFKFQSLVAIWLHLLVTAIMWKRTTCGAWNATGGFEYEVRALKNLLTNSLEQAVINLMTQLSLIPYLDFDLIVKIVPVLTAIYLIGRIAFTVGYPTRRYFGFSLWYFSITIAIFYSVWQLMNDPSLN